MSQSALFLKHATAACWKLDRRKKKKTKPTAASPTDTGICDGNQKLKTTKMSPNSSRSKILVILPRPPLNIIDKTEEPGRLRKKKKKKNFKLKSIITLVTKRRARGGGGKRERERERIAIQRNTAVSVYVSSDCGKL